MYDRVIQEIGAHMVGESNIKIKPEQLVYSII